MMTTVVDEKSLKFVKNAIVGNPVAKSTWAADVSFLRTVIECINDPPLDEVAAGTSAHPGVDSQRDMLRIEAIHIVASLAHGSADALCALLEERPHQSLLLALASMQPSDPPALYAALGRALRTFATSVADVVGPSMAGLPTTVSHCQSSAHAALEYLFETPILDIWIPYLAGSNASLRLSVAQVLSQALRVSTHRRAVVDWMLPSERTAAIKSNRGWEKPALQTTSSATRGGGWVARILTSWIQGQDTKMLEQGLLALAALTKENNQLSMVLSRSQSDAPTVISTAATLTKSRSLPIQLAACVCASNIMRANPSGSTFTPAYPPEYQLAVIQTLNRLINSSESYGIRTRAVFALHHFIADEVEICRLAHEHGSLHRLTTTLTSISPLETPRPQDWDVSEPIEVSALREACITALASIAMHDQILREAVIDTPGVTAALHTSLSHSAHAGCRYAACQCIRAISRSVAVVRTSLLDSGLGTAVIQILMRSEDAYPREDPRVTWAALASVCNLVVDVSPLREELLEEPALKRLSELIMHPDAALRLNALWVIKNMLWKGMTDLKQQVMDKLGWEHILNTLNDVDPGVQEQALNVFKNVADSPEDVEATFKALQKIIGSKLEAHTQPLLDALASALELEDLPAVQAQAASLLFNLSGGPPFVHDAILSHPRLPDLLRQCIADARPTVRHPAVCAALALVRGADTRKRKTLRELLETPLRALCDAASGNSRPRAASISGGDVSMMGVEDRREIRDKAKDTLYILEHDMELY